MDHYNYFHNNIILATQNMEIIMNALEIKASVFVLIKILNNVLEK